MPPVVIEKQTRWPLLSNAGVRLSLVLLFLLLSAVVQAHVSEQAFVLLLPTKVYISAGVVAVILTILALALLPETYLTRAFATSRLLELPPRPALRESFSLVSFGVFLLLLYGGLAGTTDPLKNPLSLFIWTVWWIGLLSLQGIAGNLWHWLNPWTGPLAILRRLASGHRHRAGPQPAVDHRQAIDAVGAWPAIVLLLAFTSFALADPVPGDPLRLTLLAFAYWLLTLLAMLVVGEEQWLQRGEFITIIMRRFAQLAVVGGQDNQWRIGLPGWQTVARPATSVSTAFFILLMLGCGSFDGLNETFWWLAAIGVNPLEFPGRSAIVNETITGLLLANGLLILCFALCVWLGLWLASDKRPGPTTEPHLRFVPVFTRLAISVLPIAFAYHIAHFATSFMVNSQYAVAALSDPLASGANYLGIGHHFVSTGFLNSRDSVRLIWLAQAAVVVIGHILSVIIAHRIAIDLFGSTRRAAISQLPLATFMIFYTFLGLWLLAAPKGA